MSPRRPLVLARIAHRELLGVEKQALGLGAREEGAQPRGSELVNSLTLGCFPAGKRKNRQSSLSWTLASARMMRLAETALLAAMQLTASRADYVPCDLATCTCAGVSLAQFEKGGPYRLSDPSKPGTQCAFCRLLCVCPALSVPLLRLALRLACALLGAELSSCADAAARPLRYALSICDTVGTAGAQNCTVNSDLGQTASFLADVGGICEALGDYNTMAAEVVAEGDHHVLHVRYNHTYGGVNQVVISFTAGSATAPGPALTQADGLYNVSWAGLTAEPPLPPPPPPPNPTPPPTPPPHAKTYECQ